MSPGGRQCRSRPTLLARRTRASPTGGEHRQRLIPEQRPAGVTSGIRPSFFTSISRSSLRLGSMAEGPPAKRGRPSGRPRFLFRSHLGSEYTLAAGQRRWNRFGPSPQSGSSTSRWASSAWTYIEGGRVHAIGRPRAPQRSEDEVLAPGQPMTHPVPDVAEEHGDPECAEDRVPQRLPRAGRAGTCCRRADCHSGANV
jgi:hypothetical protein